MLADTCVCVGGGGGGGGEGVGGFLLYNVPLAFLKSYITMADIVLVRCYGDRLSFKHSFFQT